MNESRDDNSNPYPVSFYDYQSTRNLYDETSKKMWAEVAFNVVLELSGGVQNYNPIKFQEYLKEKIERAKMLNRGLTADEFGECIRKQLAERMKEKGGENHGKPRQV